MQAVWIIGREQPATSEDIGELPIAAPIEHGELLPARVKHVVFGKLEAVTGGVAGRRARQRVCARVDRAFSNAISVRIVKVAESSRTGNGLHCAEAAIAV